MRAARRGATRITCRFARAGGTAENGKYPPLMHVTTFEGAVRRVCCAITLAQDPEQSSLVQCTTSGMIEHSAGLLRSHAREPLEEIVE